LSRGVQSKDPKSEFWKGPKSEAKTNDSREVRGKRDPYYKNSGVRIVPHYAKLPDNNWQEISIKLQIY
jgi:hypothetical protein